MAALDGALACQADMFEFDVRRAGDSTLVVHHDAEIDTRTLASFDYAEAASAAVRLGYELPRLDDVLSRARGRIRLDVELKEAGYEDAVIGALLDRGFTPDDFVVTSFERDALAAIPTLHPAIRVGLLVYDVSGTVALEMFRHSSAAFLGPDYQILDGVTLREAAAAHIPLLPWTVNDPTAMRRLLNAPALLGLITDRPVDAMGVRGGGP